MSRSASWFLLVFLLAALLLARESRQPGGSLAGGDRAFLDWLMINAKPGQPVGREVPVTLIEIDDSIAETPGRLPLQPLEYAAFMRSMGHYDPAVVAVEPVLDFPQITAGTEQILLERALGISKLLLGVQLGDSAGNGRDPGSLPALVNGVTGNTDGLPGYPEIVAAPGSRLLTLATASGAANLPKASAGPVRDVPLLFRSRGRVLPAFTLQALTLSLRLAPSEITATAGKEVRLGERLRLPINRAGRALLDVRQYGRFRRATLDDLPLIEAGQAPPSIQALAERMHSGVVVLGRTDKAARTLRLPDGRAVSPAEVFAWAATSLQQTPPVRRAGPWWDAGIVVVFGASGLAGRRWPRGVALTIAAVTGLIYLIMALSFFESSQLWLPAVLPAGVDVAADDSPLGAAGASHCCFQGEAGASGPCFRAAILETAAAQAPLGRLTAGVDPGIEPEQSDESPGFG